MPTTTVQDGVHRPDGVDRPAHADAELHHWLANAGGAAALLLESVRGRAEQLAETDHLAARALNEVAAGLSAASTNLDLLAVARDPAATEDAYAWAVDRLTADLAGWARR